MVPRGVPRCNEDMAFPQPIFTAAEVLSRHQQLSSAQALRAAAASAILPRGHMPVSAEPPDGPCLRPQVPSGRLRPRLAHERHPTWAEKASEGSERKGRSHNARWPAGLTPAGAGWSRNWAKVEIDGTCGEGQRGAHDHGPERPVRRDSRRS